MNIRNFQEHDMEHVEKVFSLYWTDPEFLKELTDTLRSYIKKDHSKELGFYIAEENGEILGIVGFKKMAEYLNPYALTNNPIELYVIASKYKRRGIGKALQTQLNEEMKKIGFSEILLYSPGTHDESWNFYEKIGFERLGELTPPDDEIGQVWRQLL